MNEIIINLIDKLSKYHSLFRLSSYPSSAVFEVVRQPQSYLYCMHELRTRQLAAQAGITEPLKAEGEIAWGQQMNRIRTIAEA